MTEPDEELARERAYLERLEAAILRGAHGEKIQKIVSDRVAQCRQVYGVPPNILATTNVDAYWRLIRGHKKAMLRLSLIEAGQLSRSELERMKQRELERRAVREFDSWDPSEKESA